MAMLGDILGAARRSARTFPRWLAAADPALARRVEKAAACSGEGAAGYVQAAVAEFDRHASEEDWATLTSRLRSADDPGAACLTTMVERRLAGDPNAHRAKEDRNE